MLPVETESREAGCQHLQDRAPDEFRSIVQMDAPEIEVFLRVVNRSLHIRRVSKGRAVRTGARVSEARDALTKRTIVRDMSR